MSAQNRTALKALISGWGATLDLELDHKPVEQHILDSMLLRRDDAGTTSVVSGSTAIDFTNYDTITVNTTQSTTITFSGLSDGDIKFLVINKNVGNVITLSGLSVTDYSQTYIDTLTQLVYMICMKSSAAFTVPLHQTFDFGDIVTSTSLLPSAWNQATPISPWTNTSVQGSKSGCWYRLNGNYTDIQMCVSRSLAFSANIFQLPVGYRPVDTMTFFADTDTSNTYSSVVMVKSDGYISHVNSNVSPTFIRATFSIPL